MVINTLTGALAIELLQERPTSFPEPLSTPVPRLLLFPHDELDFEAVMLSADGAVMCCPIFSMLAASHYFSVRGLPRAALTLLVEGERSEIPIIDKGCAYDAVYPIKCKQIYSKTVVFSAGMEHTLYTEGGKCRTRIIEAPSEINFSQELLSRLRVVEGLPDAVRSIAYRRASDGWRMASTDKTLTVDSLLPLAGLLAHQGVRGDIRIVCRGSELELFLSGGSWGEIMLRASALFPRGG